MPLLAAVPNKPACGGDVADVGLAVNVGVFRIPPPVVGAVKAPGCTPLPVAPKIGLAIPAPNGEPNTFLFVSELSGLAEPRPPNVSPLVILFVDASMSSMSVDVGF